VEQGLLLSAALTNKKVSDREDRRLTVSTIDEVVEGMMITVEGDLGIITIIGELVQALNRHRCKIPCEDVHTSGIWKNERTNQYKLSPLAFKQDNPTQ
jgi:hypothetical protein